MREAPGAELMSAKAESMNVDLPAYMQDVGQRARAAARSISRADTGMKNAALNAIADAIMQSAEQLKTENEKDLAAGRQGSMTSASPAWQKACARSPRCPTRLAAFLT